VTKRKKIKGKEEREREREKGEPTYLRPSRERFESVKGPMRENLVRRI